MFDMFRGATVSLVGSMFAIGVAGFLLVYHDQGENSSVSASAQTAAAADSLVVGGVNVLRYAQSAHPNQGGGAGHNLVWYDQNAAFNADNISITSSDPTIQPAFVQFGGNPAPGQALRLNLAFDGSDHIVSYTTKAGDTLASVASGFVDAIMANAALANSGTIAQKLPDQPTKLLINPSWRHVPQVTNASPASSVTMTITPSSGTLDVNPYISVARYVADRTPRVGDTGGAFIIVSPDAQNALTVQSLIMRSDITNLNPIQYVTRFETPRGAFALGNGIYLYDQAGHSPVGGDMGVGTINVTGGFYVNGKPVGSSPTAQTSDALQLVTQSSPTRMAQLALKNDVGTTLVFGQWGTQATGGSRGQWIQNGTPAITAFNDQSLQFNHYGAGVLTTDGTGMVSASKTGITLFDTATNQPYCIRITNGVLASTAGACR